MKKILTNVLIALILVVIISRLLSLTLIQSLVMAGLLITIIWWTTGAVDKSHASLFLLLVFSVFGGTPLKDVYQFPLSETFVVILVSFLFSQGILNSGLIDKFVMPILSNYASNIWRLLGLIFIFAFGMIFIIPQPFSRVIILSLIFSRYFDKIELEAKAKEVLMFWVFAISIFVNMSLVKGDIILNNAITMIASQPISEVEWIKYMLVPTFVFCAIATVGFKFTFNNILKSYVKKEDTRPEKFESLSKADKKHLALILAVVVLWATETIHGINGTIIVIIGTLTMYRIKLLGRQDIKSINIGLLIFLTAVFSIGAVMKESGIATIIFSNLVFLFPKTFSLKYVVIMVIVSIILHMILGSNITTMSVIIPGLMSISKGVANPIIIMFTIFVSICAHFVLPYQHGVILIGEGSKYYTSKTTLKYAPVLTLLTILSILFVYLKWWKLMGLT